VKISFKTSQQNVRWDDLRAVWQEADDIEVFDGGWLFDHFYPLGGDASGPCMEAWTVAAALASVTERLRIGHMVTSNTYRHPAVVANSIATIDHVSHGRLDFGFGAGWFEEEHAAYGIDLPPLTERFDRFDEALEVIHLLLTEPVADFTGRYYHLDGAFCEPKPLQRPRPPFVIGGKGERRLLRSVARWADHYNFPGSDLEEYGHKIDVLAGHCDAAGRDFAEIETSIQIRVGDIGEAADLASRAREAGVDHVILLLAPPHDIELLEPLAEAVAPLV
jgi:F420-dependent oxidoreductase-like protein